MNRTDLIKVATHESIMTLLFVKKDGTLRKVIASRCNMMCDKVSKDNGHVWKHEGTPTGLFSYIDVADNKWKRLLISNLIAVKCADGTVFSTSKRALKAAEKALGETF